MRQAQVLVTPWPGETELNEEAIRVLLARENLSPYRWANGPHDIYAAHTHPYDKVIVVVSGSITFGLPQLDRQFNMNAGDRLDLPQGTVHDAFVGSNGVVCLEAHRYNQ